MSEKSVTKETREHVLRMLSSSGKLLSDAEKLFDDMTACKVDETVSYPNQRNANIGHRASMINGACRTATAIGKF